MERVQALIHRLQEQAAQQVPAYDLLITTEMLFHELARNASSQLLSNGGAVTVWLPKGISAFGARDIRWPSKNPLTTSQPAVAEPSQAATAIVAPKPEEKPAPEQEQVAKPSAPQQVEEPLVQVVQEEKEPVEIVSEPEEIAPVVEQKPDEQQIEAPIVVEEEPMVVVEQPLPAIVETPVSVRQEPLDQPQEDEPVVILPSPEEVKEEYPLVFNLEVEPTQEELDQLARQPKEEEESVANIEEEPKAALLEEKPAPQLPGKPGKLFPDYPDAAEIMKNIFPVSPSPVPPKKEVNELVADPAATALNQRVGERGREVSDMLASAGPKIADIRKAISINEKYQMISSLFRGDEDMFERSVRTLNNFGSLPEARFWMQRELVVKLGWNEEDELVQTFYRLVSRRFA